MLHKLGLIVPRRNARSIIRNKIRAVITTSTKDDPLQAAKSTQNVGKFCTFSTGRCAFLELFVETRILVSKKTAAKLLSISLRSVENLISRNQLRVRRIGRRVVIPVQALLDFANNIDAITSAMETPVKEDSNEQ